jgi:membrane-associated phospholipid phosphatase
MARKSLDWIIKWLGCCPIWLAIIIELSIFLGCYSLSNHIKLLPYTPLAPYTFIDNAIPFMDWTITIYNSVFILLLLGIPWILTFARGQSLLACFLLLPLHLVFFVFYPVELARIGLKPSDTWEWGYKIMWILDAPRNCFPSLHVAISYMVAFFVLQKSKSMGWVFLTWATLITLSTLTTKQHFIVDVIGGMITSTGVFWIVFKKLPWRITNV